MMRWSSHIESFTCTRVVDERQLLRPTLDAQRGYRHSTSPTTHCNATSTKFRLAATSRAPRLLLLRIIEMRSNKACRAAHDHHNALLHKYEMAEEAFQRRTKSCCVCNYSRTMCVGNEIKLRGEQLSPDPVRTGFRIT